MEFSKRLKQLRKEKKMTQTDLAKVLNVSGGTVAMWEAGKRMPQFETLFAMCSFFDKSLDYLLGTSDDSKNPNMTDGEKDQLVLSCIVDELEDTFRKYALLDEYGKSAVNAVLRNEFNRSQEQGTLNKEMNISVSVKFKS